MTDHRQSNDLIHETSPYLLQHAHNPVNWRAWNRESLGLARDLDRPILLSIGYSACHWCHVMERESFEDEDTADFMNANFVCIKIDREERPDLDKIYQLAHHMIAQRAGGWPLNVVIAPDSHAPFFAGTYFPKHPRHGMPAFVDVLERVTGYFRSHRDELTGHASAVQEAFRRTEPAGEADVNPEIFSRAARELRDSYDPEHGGFGAAPKFPHPTTLELCLRYRTHNRDDEVNQPRSLQMAQHTLAAMARGGLCDQLGGGFYRYSVDRAWIIPHFEKMLYDNAQLLQLYVDAWQACGEDLFRDTATSTANWVIAEMQSPSGGYYSSIDADSEGEEGKFYVWSTDEIRSIIGEREYAAMEVRYGLAGTPNFEGKWHLNIAESLETVAGRCLVDVESAASLLSNAKKKLLESRAKRIHPQLDDKILTAWNALMIKSMAHAGRKLGQEEFVSSAQRALEFVRNSLWRNGRLLATARDDRAHLNAYLDDYVFLIDAVLELNQSRWRSSEMDFAITLADTVLEQFEDNDLGGLYFTSNDHEVLLHRTKPTADDATPSGNGIAAGVLLRLGHLLGETRYLETAERILRLFSATANRLPSAHGSLLIAMEEYLYPPRIIVLRSDPKTTREWTRSLLSQYAPDTMIMTIPNDEENLPGVLNNLKSALKPAGETTAYICQGVSCSPPITRLEEFIDRVKQHNIDS